MTVFRCSNIAANFTNLLEEIYESYNIISMFVDMEHIKTKWNNCFISFCIDIDNAKWDKKIKMKTIITLFKTCCNNAVYNM